MKIWQVSLPTDIMLSLEKIMPKSDKGTGTNWAMVSCGLLHTGAIKNDGTLWAWGGNGHGQLGLGDTTERSTPTHTPTQVETATNWASVSCGHWHTLAIKTDGTLWAWGDNNVGQLGLGDTTERSTPTQVETATNWASVSCGNDHTLAIKTDGTLWAWGGNGDIEDTPNLLGTGTNWSAVSYGGSHIGAIKTDGTLWAWGWNYYGQLGLGDNTDRNTPAQVGRATNWASVSCGGSRTFAIKTDGTLWAWGNNPYGQLGLGYNTDRNTPVQVEMKKMKGVRLPENDIYSVNCINCGAMLSRYSGAGTSLTAFFSSSEAPKVMCKSCRNISSEVELRNKNGKVLKIVKPNINSPF